MNNKISIVIPAYNTADVIERTLKSIENQTYKNYEVVIINDGSNDGTKKLLDNYKKNKSNVVVYHQENQGVSAARNKGLEICTGDFVCFLDSDDSYEPTFLEEMLQYIMKNESEVVYCGFNYIDRKGHINVRKNIAKSSHLESFLGGSMFHFSGMLIRKKSLFNRNIRFNCNRSIGEDVLFTVEVLNHLKACSLDKCLFNYFYRKNSVMRNPLKTQEHFLKDVASYDDICTYIRNHYHSKDKDLVLFLACVHKNERILACMLPLLASFDFKQAMLERKKLDFSIILNPESNLSKQRKRTLFFIKNNNPFRFILGAIYYRYIRRPVL